VSLIVAERQPRDESMPSNTPRSCVCAHEGGLHEMEAFTEDMKTKLNDSRLQKCFEDLIQPNTPYLTWLVGINHRNETMYDINVIFLTYRLSNYCTAKDF
jgi:hypothetical protein